MRALLNYLPKSRRQDVIVITLGLAFIMLSKVIA